MINWGLCCEVSSPLMIAACIARLTALGSWPDSRATSTHAVVVGN